MLSCLAEGTGCTGCGLCFNSENKTNIYNNPSTDIWIDGMTVTPSAIALYGHCCRRHVVGQRIVSDISVVHSCRSMCSLCSESNNANLLLRLLIVEHLGCFAYQTTWQQLTVLQVTILCLRSNNDGLSFHTEIPAFDFCIIRLQLCPLLANDVSKIAFKIGLLSETHWQMQVRVKLRYSLYDRGGKPRLRFMLNAWLCPRYKFSYYY